MPEIPSFRRKMARATKCMGLLREKWGWMEYILLVVGLVTVVATVVMMMGSKKGETIMNVWSGEEGMPGTSSLVNLTLLEAAASKGAVCLDGTLPAYHLDRGFGSGSNSWLIHLEGGGWCNDLVSCARRKSSKLGSSLYMERQIVFSGILSNKPSENPDFYNWNRAKVRYCDGASYSGDVEDENEEYKIYFRGQRIWQAIMDDFLAKGMDKADQAFLSGCSAGGLGSFLHCDKFRDLLPAHTKAKCLGDAGFFIDAKDVSGIEHIKSFYNEVVTLQGVANQLPNSCISQLDPTRCFFPQHLLSYTKTPFFILNTAYDWWQIQNILAPNVADPEGHWHKCKLNIKSCTQSQLETLQDFRTEMLRALKAFEGMRTTGMFINSCFEHCQTESQETWFSSNSPRLNNKTIAEAVGDWYFDRMPRQNIDCPYPCDSTCHDVFLKNRRACIHREIINQFCCRVI